MFICDDCTIHGVSWDLSDINGTTCWIESRGSLCSDVGSMTHLECIHDRAVGCFIRISTLTCCF